MVGVARGAKGAADPVFIPSKERLNGTTYLDIIRDHYAPQLKLLRGDSFAWIQGGATCHTEKSVVKWLDKNVRERIKGWPPASPDLNVCDFFLRRYLEQTVNEKENTPKGIKQKNAILKHSRQVL